MKQDSETRRDERNKSLNGNSPSLPAQARQHAPAAIAELVRIIENTRSDAARLAAICILFDRGLGKPPKPLDIAIKDRVKPAPPPATKSWSGGPRISIGLAMGQWSMDVSMTPLLELLPGKHRRHTENRRRKLMSQTSAARALELISKPALTITESADDYDSLVKSLQQAISPHGFIEQMYVADIECNRLGEFASASHVKWPLINMAFRAALKNLLDSVLEGSRRNCSIPRV